MQAMIFHHVGEPLVARDLPVPAPRAGEVLLRVRACGVCRTDLHIVHGELPTHRLPLVPGHQIVGEVLACGPGVEELATGQRVGVPWLGWTCRTCEHCRAGRENLCDRAQFTGYDRDGGFAEHAVAAARYCLPLPPGYGDLEAAPLLCAGLIGFRALRMTGAAARVGLYGFGAAAHIVTQVARYQGREVFAFTRDGDTTGQAFARRLGAVWAGDASLEPPTLLDAALIFAPVGTLVPLALRAVRKGGMVVCAGIHMSDIPAMPYTLLWGERSLRSVANLTRADGLELLALAPRVPVQTHVTTYALGNANEALADLEAGKINGAAVLTI